MQQQTKNHKEPKKLKNQKAKEQKTKNYDVEMSTS